MWSGLVATSVVEPFLFERESMKWLGIDPCLCDPYHITYGEDYGEDEAQAPEDIRNRRHASRRAHAETKTIRSGPKVLPRDA
jgi:hypothetical protein